MSADDLLRNLRGAALMVESYELQLEQFRAARDELIFDAWREGARKVDLADASRLTRARVDRILNQHR